MPSMKIEAIRLMNPLFGPTERESIPASVKQLSLEPTSFEDALALNALWHRTQPKMGVGFVRRMPFLSFAAVHEGIVYAVAIWSNPVARNLPQKRWLELRRLAVGPEAPHCTASWMLGKMAKWIAKNRPGILRLISYQNTEFHQGTIYKAAGWAVANVSEGDEWNRPGRSRPAVVSDAPKVRWEKVIRG
jgi:hypothetical protein